MRFISELREGGRIQDVYLCKYRQSAVTKNGSLHRAAVGMVNAKAQAGDMERLLPLLSGEEAEVFRRGRNVKVHSVPKHASLGDYHAATGLEALFGYLYLMGRRERLNALFAAIVEEN